MFSLKRILPFLIAIFSICLTSCKKDPAPVIPQIGTFKLEFENSWGEDLLSFDSVYTTDALELIRFTDFKYYISNVILKKSDGTNWKHPESYFLVSGPGESVLTFSNVPQGDYTGISFVIGVDSTRNVSGSQTGALDPVNGMFWSWNSGYRFITAEGTSPQSAMGTFEYHIGGFSGADNALRTFSTDFSGAVLGVKSTAAPQIHLHVDISKLFNGPNPISVAAKPMIQMPGADALKAADNFLEAFEFEHLHY